MDESTNKSPACHPNGRWVVASNGAAFCSVCGRGLNAPLKIDTPMPEVTVAEETKTVTEASKTERDPLLVERETTHGSFKKNAEDWTALCRAIRPDQFNLTQRLAVNQMLLKLARASQNPQVKDHWDDIAGYAKLAGEACSE